MEKDQKVEDIGEEGEEDEEEEEPPIPEETLNENLIIACKANEIEDAQNWISKGANVQAADKQGWSSLLWASSNGNEEIVRLLLRHKA